MQRLCAKICTNWRLSLPAAQVTEKLHKLGEAGVLVLYPALPQNLHKFPFVTVLKNLSKIAQKRVHFGAG